MQWTGHVRPAGPAVAVRPSGPTAPDGQPLSGWWWRALAFLVDSVVLWVVGYLVTLPAQLAIQRTLTDNQARLQERLERGQPVSPDALWGPMLDAYADHLLALVVVPVVLAVGYHSGFLRWRGATPGKLLCGLRVRSRVADGRVSFAAIAARLSVQLGPGWLALGLGIWTGSFGTIVLGFLCSFLFVVLDALVALGPRRQTIHDRAARTVVVRTR